MTNLQADAAQLRASRKASQRAIGDNYAFEERVGDARLAGFERDVEPGQTLLDAHAEYFDDRVQGEFRKDMPVTFTLENKDALWPYDVEPNQKIVRLERIDALLTKTGSDYAKIKEAIDSPARDLDVIEDFLRIWETLPGARPAFIAFKSEVEDELRQPDWLLRLRNRLGLGHYDPAPPDQAMSFALMEYLAKDVLAEFDRVRAFGAERAFAMPTVLDGKPSEFFMPSPRELSSGFAADLGETPGPMIRELLHVRLTYRPHHLVRLGQPVGPLPPVPLATVRDRHLDTVRNHASRPGFGNHMTGEVDD